MGSLFRYLLPGLLVGGLLLLQTNLFADDKSQVPPPNGEQCVEPTDVMRKMHFEFILHQRDETVLHGIRTKKHSFTGCIDCHITANEQGEYARYSNAEQHFCANCHEYAAVTIDCFQCHADRPEKAIRATGKEFKTTHVHTPATHSKIELGVFTNAQLH